MKKKNELSGLESLAVPCGVGAIVAFATSVSYCIWMSPWFVWTDHALSHLGQFGDCAWVFQMGMMVTGALTLAFSYGVYVYLPSYVKPAAGGFMVAGAGLIGVGLFPDGVLHLASVALMLGALAVGLFVLGSKTQGKRMSNVASVVLCIGMASLFALHFFEGVAITETIVFLGVAVLIVLFTVDMMPGHRGFLEKKARI